MEALVVILIIILAALVITSVVLIGLAIALSRNISRSQRNIKDISGRVDEVTTLAGLATSMYGIVAKAMPKKSTQKATQKPAKKAPRRKK